MKYLICTLAILSLCFSGPELAQAGSASFEITVTFDSEYPENVTVQLNCVDANPAHQTATFNPQDVLVLFVEEVSESTTCRIGQNTPPDSAFSTTYLANGIESGENCAFGTENLLAENTCLIVNVAWPVDMTDLPGPIHGYQVVRQYGVIPGGLEWKVEARCSSGKVVLGGGYALLSGGAWNLISLGPSLDGKGFFLRMRSESEEPQEVEVTAICAGHPSDSR